MSSTQEYREARVQYWEEMLGFECRTNSTRFRAFTACKASCDHVDAMKASAAYHTTDYQISNSKALQNFTHKFFDEWASQLWPDHNKCPKWLHDDDDADRLRVPRDSKILREHLWRFVETKCMSHFTHNPDLHGTLATEPGTPPAEHDQQASLWANNKRPPRPARGSKRRSSGCVPCYNCIDEYDDDKEPVFFKRERSSETMRTVQAKLAESGSAYHLRTHNTDTYSALDAGGLFGPDCRPRKRCAPDDRNTTSYGHMAAFKKSPHIPFGSAKTISSHAVHHPSTPNASHGTNQSPKDIQLALYIDGQKDLAGVIEITNVTTRDQLFDMIQQDLQDILGIGDRFDVVRFQRTDGEAFPRPNARSMPIKRFGQQDMWNAMVKTMLEYNIGDLEGFVIVKRGVDSKCD